MNTSIQQDVYAQLQKTGAGIWQLRLGAACCSGSLAAGLQRLAPKSMLARAPSGLAEGRCNQ
jgi:hypothetical protein